MGKYILIGAVLVVVLVFATQQMKTQAVQANTGAGVANNLLGPLASAIGGAIARSTSSTSTNSSGLTQAAPPSLAFTNPFTNAEPAVGAGTESTDGITGNELDSGAAYGPGF